MGDRPHEAERWLAQAQHDLRAAELNAVKGYPEIACFLALQSAEKALKAYLYAQGDQSDLSHATHVLIQQCAEYHPSFEDLLDGCRLLDQYYVATRYPNYLPDGIPHDVYTARQADEATGIAKRVLDLVSAQLDLD